MNPIVDNPLSWVYFPTALLLGALHALEPGHAKTLTAAYLIGIKGTKRDALILGLSVAFTHSLVVVGISVTSLWIGKETFTADVSHWLQLASGLIVIVLGTWMLARRMKMLKNAHHHHHKPVPIEIKSDLLAGMLEMVDTPEGEKLKFSVTQSASDFNLRIIINRSERLEEINLIKSPTDSKIYFSAVTPNEPHEFSAEFEFARANQREVIPFEMNEIHDPRHSHNHDHLSDDAHARAHAEAIPEYVKKGERPTLLQIMSFGAAGGMIPCPASITVMLLALSIGKFVSGLFAVAGFSIGLAITLVGIGLAVVAGFNRIKGAEHFNWISRHSPIISALVVILSGCAALLFAH